MMTRIVKTLFFLGVALLLACLIAPGFIDWNQHKPEVMARISPFFQRKIDVAGKISFSVLPQPEILLQSVTVAGATGSLTEPLMTLKSLEAHVALEPLLEGRVEVENINLTEPVLNLDIAADGKTSLSGVLAPSADVGAAASSIQLNQVSITNGTLHYSNQLTGTQKTFDNLNLSVKAATLLGPYKITGNMLYQKTKVNIAIDNSAPFDKAMSAPVNISFSPAENMPQVKLDGALALQSGFDIEGELAVTGGRLGGLVNVPALNALDFMNDAVDMTGTLAYKGDQFALNDIKAKFGKDGKLEGKLSVQLSQKGSNGFEADLGGSNLTVTAKPSDTYMDVPAGYRGGLRFKGKNIIWDGRKLETADISTSFNDKDWTIKSALISLPGNTQVKLAGTITPKTNTAAYTALQLTTDDLGKLVDSFASANTSIFSALGGTAAPFKQLQMTSNLDISPAKISLFDIDATIDNKEKVSGVLNIERVVTKPNVSAKLNLTDWDSAAFPDAFVQAVLKSDADLELTADNFTRGNLKIAGLAFKGKSSDGGLVIDSMSGHLSDKDIFTLKGRATSLAPVAGLDVSYTLKTPHASEVARDLGVDLPPLAGENFEINTGTIKGDAGKFAFTAQGGSDSLTLWGQEITHAAFALEQSAPSMLKISGLTGTVWNGQLYSDATFTQQAQPAPSWSSTFKGSVKQVSLQKLQDALGLKGFTTEKGDIDFDLASADNTAAGATGKVDIQAGSLVIPNFSADGLYNTLHQLTTMPDNLSQVVDDSLHKNGSSAFKDVHGAFKIDHGKASIDSLTLANGSIKMPVMGSADIAGGSYAVSGDLQLLKPENFPLLKVTRNSDDKDYKTGYKADGKFENYVSKILPPPEPQPAPPAPAPVQAVDKPPVSLTPAETATQPPAPQPAAAAPAKKDQPIGDILQRLNEGDNKPAPTPEAPAAAPAPQPLPEKNVAPVQAPMPLTSPPQPPAPAQPDVNKVLQQQMQQMMMQQGGDAGSPVPLAPLSTTH